MTDRDTSLRAADAAASPAEFKLTGAGLIAIERQRQVLDEGYQASGDDRYSRGELLGAAQAYIEVTNEADYYEDGSIPDSWPWDDAYWKPKGSIRNLARAGALIAAEIDRLIRAGEADA